VNFQIRAFQISFLLHGLIFALAVILSTYMVPCKKTLVIYFDLLKPASDATEVKPAASAPVMRKKLITPKAPQPAIIKEPLLLPNEKIRIAQTPVPDIPPVVKLPETHKLDSRQVEQGMADQAKAIKEDSAGIWGISKKGSQKSVGTGEAEGLEKGTGMGGNADDGKDTANRKYLNDHFAYIRDKILRNISYPDTARRMGWQGIVILSFIITTDGSVRAFKVIQSSGFKILDRSAVETVRDASPFPMPPGEARLVIPINYRLE